MNGECAQIGSPPPRPSRILCAVNFRRSPLPRLRAVLAALALGVVPAAGQLLTAFPGAEGAGKWTAGGRGGRVIAVTNLKDAGPGSLRAAVEAAGRRTVVFRVGGTIFLKSPLRVRQPFLTLAGQTAPGGGITVAGHEFRIEAGEVIARYLRFRPGDVSGRDVDAVSVVKGRNIILDHLSASWGVDETLSVGPDASEVTVQWCLISESLHRSVHSSGEPHGKGSLLRGRHGARLSFHHNLYAHHADRAPMVQGLDPAAQDPLGVRLDFRNNVIYDWGSVAEGWEAAGANRNREAAARCNFVNNAYLTGPGTAPGWLPVPQFPFYAYRYWAFEELSTHARAHWSGNTCDGQPWKNNDGQPDPTWMVSVPASVAGVYFLAQPAPFENAELPAVTADEAVLRVLAGVGASRVSDAVDLRVLNQVLTRGGDLIDSQNDVGGWPALAGGPAPPDRDRDGLPDAWEREHDLKPGKADSGKRAPDGRTWLEHYHEQLLDPEALSLSVTCEGPGEVIAEVERLPIGSGGALQVLPEPGHIVDRIDWNGAPLAATTLDHTGPLWSDTRLHFVFARPRIPLPAEFARPGAVLIARDAALNGGLGGTLHFSVSAKGAVSGRLRHGTLNRAVRGRVIAREFENPRLRLEAPVAKQAPLVLDLELAGGGLISGQITLGEAAAALNGWLSPWHSRREPLPPPRRGVVTGALESMTDPGLPPENGGLRLQTSASGQVRVRARFPDGRLALASTRLGPDGQWLLRTRAISRRAATHGQGALDVAAALSGRLIRLLPEETRDYDIRNP